ncbi:uncharacterized protein JCM6883_007445 [Sporobolomyces salmoneus]|uniref:uncharacterized protein n=1 Tax=Sporobolomyces salmoneus TaxID=183962 RepID=UPI0031771DD2
MPSYNLPQFTQLPSSSSPDSSMPTSRPVLAPIQPNSIPPPPLPPKPKVHMRAHSSPPAYICAIPSSKPFSTPPPSTTTRRKPLSKRYTRPASLSHLSARSPLQAHSIPSFSLSHSSTRSTTTEGSGEGNDERTLFEEMLSMTLERRMREKVESGKRVKGGEKTGLGGLKPGRELWMWSAVNRCSKHRTTTMGVGMEVEVDEKSWRGSALANGGRNHSRSHTVPNLKIMATKEKKEEEDSDDDDDDDEPLARKLQEAIEKRERQLVQIKAERDRKSLEVQTAEHSGGEGGAHADKGKTSRGKENVPETTKVRTKAPPPSPRPIVLDVQVKIRLPTSPEPVFLKPLSGTSPSSTSNPTPTNPSSSPPLPSPPTLLELGPPLISITDHNYRRSSSSPSSSSSSSSDSASKRTSKRLRKNPTINSFTPPSSPNPGFLSLSNRSLSLPTLPPKIATTPSSTSFFPTIFPQLGSLSPIPPTRVPPLNRSRSENIPPLGSMSTGVGGGRNRKLSIGMKRTRSDQNGERGFNPTMAVVV